ncbi:hypothetical protein Clacol_001736 [Clathrus columnatus]|uniref:Uncharacterized protein n=1 Tax=Clathrus columnatus TaxID=1419009 RepID=A0AAV5A2N5_9AGAM|nr:hypothetical protein Clacol_001736 [Clathrus columnatus]
MTSHSPTKTSINSSSNSANITVTVVVSNPTDDLSPPQQDASRQGFFSHTGGVAGTFLVIGLFSTSLFLCFFFWIKRRIRRKRASRGGVYMQDNYRSLAHSIDRQTTPEPRASRRSVSVNRQNSTPALTHSKAESVERIPFPLMGHSPSPYQAEPGEYDPYKPEAVNKVYSNDYAEASEYQKYLNALTD